jgi:DNA-binding MarR family transcriptional regulator
MAMRVDPRQGRLEAIALGEIGPAEAFPLVRELLAEDAPRFARRVYLALQDVVLRLVSDRLPGGEAAQWLDVCGRASVLMRQGGAEVISHRVEALGDMVERTSRFFEAQPMDEVLGRRHVPDVLRLLDANGGRTSRATVLAATGLGQSNLSRMLTMLEGHGLVRRSKSGREAEVALTEAGRTALANLDGQRFDVRPAIVWQAQGIGICVASATGTVLSANLGFEEAVGTPAAVALASVSAGSGAEDVRTAENRWVRRIEVGEVDGGTASVWVDVSDFHLAMAESDMQVSAAEAQVAGLREAIATAQASAAAAERRLHRQQLSIEMVRERAVGRLASMASLVHERFPRKGQLARHVEEMPYQQIVAIKEALNNFLIVQVHSHRHHSPVRQNGMAIFKDVIASTYALTNSRVVVDYPDWLRTEKVDYMALTEPLRHFLLKTCGAVRMSIDRDERNVVVHGIGHPMRECQGSRQGPFPVMDAALMRAFAETWAEPGVDVRLTGHTSPDDGIEFRMSVPRSAGPA